MDTTVLVDGRHFTEDPRWHEGRLWYSDFYGHAVHSVGPDDDDRIELELDDQPSGLGWLPDGRLLVVAMTSRQVRRLEPDGSLVLHADLSHIATYWCNDMLVDTHGRAYVGHFGLNLDAYVAEHGAEALMSPDAPTLSHVILVQPDGTVEVAADEMRFPNGTVVTPDGRTLIVAETLALRLTAFDIDDDGRLSNRRVWADLSTHLIPPDGICLDADGAVWVANALGSECVRVLEGGEITDRVTTTQRAFACNLGGDDGRTLFVCTAATSEAEACTAERTARIEVATVDGAGAGPP